MENNYINKMQSIADILNKILIIIISAMFIYISVLFMDLINDCIEIYHSNFSSLATMITNNNVSLPTDSLLMMASKMYPAILSVKLIRIAMVIAVFISAIILYNTLKSVAKARPFDGNISKNFSKMGKIILVIGLLSPIAEFCAEKIIWLIYKPLLISIIPQTDGFNIFSPGVSINLFVVFLGAAIILLAYIFRYGEELQKLSDETL
ncbi:MAG: hypothetical protein IJ410_07475 [Oscillospiraceae bacterium]|nr:hypothetical protein [Oscillospiraceae bacterium]